MEGENECYSKWELNSSLSLGFNKNKEKEVSLKGHTILSVIYTSVKIIFQTTSDSRLVQR